ncbi:MAG: YfaZ family outer membrane protein [Panacagrimonas sp.]
MRFVALLLLVGFALPSQAELFDINVGEDAVRANLNGPLSRAFDGAKGRYEVGGLVASEDDQDVASAHLGLMLAGDAGAPQANVEAGIGLRAQYVGAEDDDGGGIAFGGQFDVRLPGYDRIGFFIYGYYGPDATSFGDVEDFHEFAASLGYEILKDAMIYVGYRELNADFGDEGPELEADGIHFGMRLDF